MLSGLRRAEHSSSASQKSAGCGGLSDSGGSYHGGMEEAPLSTSASEDSQSQHNACEYVRNLPPALKRQHSIGLTLGALPNGKCVSVCVFG